MLFVHVSERVLVINHPNNNKFDWHGNELKSTLL